MPAAFAAIRGVAEFLDGQDARASPGSRPRPDREIEIRLADPLPIFPSLLTDRRDARSSPAAGEPARRSLGTGPFQVASSTRPDRVVLERNPRYWREPPRARPDRVPRVALRPSAIAEGLRVGRARPRAGPPPAGPRGDPARAALPRGPRRDAEEEHLLRPLPHRQRRRDRTRPSATRSPAPSARRTSSGARSAASRLPATGLIPPGILGHDPGRRQPHVPREKAIEMIRSCGLPLPVRLRAAVHPILQNQYAALTRGALPHLGGARRRGRGRDEDDARVPRVLARRTRRRPDGSAAGSPTTTTRTTSRSRSSTPATAACALLLLARGRPDPRGGARRGAAGRPREPLPEVRARSPRLGDPRPALPRRGLPDREPAACAACSSAAPRRTSTTPSSARPRRRRRGRAPTRRPAAGSSTCRSPASSGSSIRPSAETVGAGARSCQHLRDADARARRARGSSRGSPPSSSPENDGTRFRFRLRPGVRFHDGRRLTARDVRYSFERLLADAQSDSRWLLSPDPRRPAAPRRQGAPTSRASTSSRRRSSSSTSRSRSSFFPALISYAATAIVPEGTGDGRHELAARAPSAPGPFRVVSFEPGRRLELERNPHYWREGYPRSEGLVFRFGVSPEEIREEFLAGRLSLALGPAPGRRRGAPPRSAVRRPATGRARASDVLRRLQPPPRTAHGRGPAPERSFEPSTSPGLVRRTLGRLAIPAHGLIPPGLLGYSASGPESAAVVAAAPSDSSVEADGLARDGRALGRDPPRSSSASSRPSSRELTRGLPRDRVPRPARQQDDGRVPRPQPPGQTRDLIVGPLGRRLPGRRHVRPRRPPLDGGNPRPVLRRARARPLAERGSAETDPRARHSHLPEGRGAHRAGRAAAAALPRPGLPLRAARGRRASAGSARRR